MTEVCQKRGSSNQAQIRWMACRINKKFIPSAKKLAKKAKAKGLNATAKKCARSVSHSAFLWAKFIKPEVDRGTYTSTDINIVEHKYNIAQSDYMKCLVPYAKATVDGISKWAANNLKK